MWRFAAFFPATNRDAVRGQQGHCRRAAVRRIKPNLGFGPNLQSARFSPKLLWKVAKDETMMKLLKIST